MGLSDLPYVASGFGIGLLVGLTGVGGGSLTTPLLVLIFGISPTVAVGTVVHGSACGAGSRSGIESILPDPDAPRALQAEPEPPSPYPTAAPQGDQLAGL